MTRWTIALCWLACWVSTGAAAQKWTVYTPAERDFQVLFPQPPTRAAEAEGAVAFKARAEDIEYVVYRRDPRQDPAGDGARAIERRLLREHGDDRAVRRMGEDDGYPETEEHVFRITNTMSIHRLFVARDRYYELVVRSYLENFPEARNTARDFFGSFRAAGIGLAPATATPGVAPDVLCKDRSNAFSRTFCEYRTCLQPGYFSHPYCKQLFGR
ncbi:MAG: hypothetical protein HYY78_21120 [Betaproteobacteria bacterium]|nr:hypothetical protein [Betaproteobacteria bacterium]